MMEQKNIALLYRLVQCHSFDSAIWCEPKTAYEGFLQYHLRLINFIVRDRDITDLERQVKEYEDDLSDELQMLP